jgi:hypothetical protein
MQGMAWCAMLSHVCAPHVGAQKEQRCKAVARPAAALMRLYILRPPFDAQHWLHPCVWVACPREELCIRIALCV